MNATLPCPGARPVRRRASGFAFWRPYLYVGPSVILLLIFYVYPILNNFYLSLFKWDLINPMVFVGTANYRALFENRTFGQILSNTLVQPALRFIAAGNHCVLRPDRQATGGGELHRPRRRCDGFHPRAIKHARALSLHPAQQS